jgi:hypothetical protein
MATGEQPAGSPRYEKGVVVAGWLSLFSHVSVLCVGWLGWMGGNHGNALETADARRREHTLYNVCSSCGLHSASHGRTQRAMSHLAMARGGGLASLSPAATSRDAAGHQRG